MAFGARLNGRTEEWFRLSNMNGSGLAGDFLIRSVTMLRVHAVSADLFLALRGWGSLE